MKFICRSVFTAETFEVTVTEGVVTAAVPAPNVEDCFFISPGFFDIQVNGYAGIDYSSGAFKGSDLETMVKMLKKTGTTRHLPTIITGPEERIVNNLEKMAAFLDKKPDIAAAVPGFHIEGPFISDDDGPRGAHDAAYTRDPDFNEFLRWQEASGGRIRIVTLAPERPGALDFIRKITRKGVVAAIGHTAAKPEEISAAVQAGARLSTHLGNGSHAFLPRLSNYLWEQLADDTLSASIIADGFHLPSAVLKSFYRMKGPENLILTSDVSPLGGCKPGYYKWDNISVEVFGDGHVGLAGTPYLAGAGHLLDRDIANVINVTGCSLSDAVTLCTINPLKLLSFPEERNFPSGGTEAGAVIFSYSMGDARLRVEGVY